MLPVFLISLLPTVLCGTGIGAGDDWSYCKHNNCGEYQGHCKGDDQCSGSLVCGEDNCKDFNPNTKWTSDCCINKDQSKWVTYLPGNINLIFSVPHNGFKKPDIIPDRVGNVPKLADVNTWFIAEGARARIKESGGGIPHMVISLLHRSKMDPNREEIEAAQNNPEALLAYNSFHDTIKQVRDSMDGPGLLLDFHGQAHKAGRIELGYLISKNGGNGLNAACTDASKLPPASSTSIASLVSRFNHTLEDLLSGNSGLGSRIEANNSDYKAVPSSSKACPGSEDYFNGGWITEQYGSNNGGQMDAIQLEMPSKLRTAMEKPEEERLEVRTEFGKRLGDVILDFFNAFYA